jgi:ABC-type uncharacterized transport system ATPase subunit
MIEKIVDYGNSSSIKVKESRQVQELLKTLVDNNIIITKFAADEISLQEIFIELAGNDNTNSIAAEVGNV